MTSELIRSDLLNWLRGRQWQAQNGFIPKAHAVIGDPPYFLGSITKRFGGKNAAPARFGRDGAFQRQSRGFMGKTWDGFEDVWGYQAWVTEWATLLLDFVYPGTVLALFGGTRTYHRLASGLEDAGWEVFDCLMYLYGSGFPKAADIGKLIDKAAGVERAVIVEGASGKGSQTIAVDGDGLNVNFAPRPITAPATPEAVVWDGYKTALKPAYEPIILARAPRGNATYADLAQWYGTGALNIDPARIGVDTVGWGFRPSRGYGGYLGGNERPSTGRYPANIVLDKDAARMLDEQAEEFGRSYGNYPSSQSVGTGGGTTYFPTKAQGKVYADTGSVSRFFYTAKASTWEREAGLADFVQQIVNDGRDTPIDNAYQRGDTKRRNTHPTVKPIQLITWLAKLLLPPQLDTPRRVLVPFAGSGSEMIGAQLAGWDEVIGIEREAEYCAINEARRVWWSKFETYEQAELAYRPFMQTTDDLSDLPLFAGLEATS